MRLLSVDWDYFLPIPEDDPHALYDWGHTESISFMKDGIWTIRAGSFLFQGYPLPGLSGDVKDFWGRFCNLCGELYFADSHSMIYSPKVRSGITEIWNFDAHHDAYWTSKEVQTEGKVNCENWATVFASMGVTVKTFFPTWNNYSLEYKMPLPLGMPRIQLDPGTPFHKQFDRIFVCRSGAWTPSWLEEAFWDFIASCPTNTRVNVDGVSRREFNIADAQEIARQQAMVMQLNANLVNK